MRHARRIGQAMAGLAAAFLLSALPAEAQGPWASSTSINPILDCSAGAGGCTIRVYGLSTPASYAQAEPIPDKLFLFDWNSIQGSYFGARAQQDPRFNMSQCSALLNVRPVFGQVYLREESDCVPPVLGAGVCRDCDPNIPGHCTDGAPCGVANPALGSFDCPFGLCSNLDAGCPVEVASDMFFPGTENVYGSVSYTAAEVGGAGFYTSVAFNGSHVTDPSLHPTPLRPGIGRRFQHPAGGTTLYWTDLVPSSGKDAKGNDLNESTLCCHDAVAGFICASQRLPYNQYPALTDLGDEQATEMRKQAPWHFASDDPATPEVEGSFENDPNFTVPGQLYGNCTIKGPVFRGAKFLGSSYYPCSAPGGHANYSCTGAGAPLACCTGPGKGSCANADSNSQCTAAQIPYPCCTGAGTGKCGEECVIPGLGDLGPCDLRDHGQRQNPFAGWLADGSPNPGHCNTAPFTWRGTPGQNCSLFTFYNECLSFPHDEACTATGQPFPCCTGAGTGTCGAAQTCVLEGHCASDRRILCNARADDGDECAGVGGACDLGRSGRCSVDDDVRCSPGPSPYPKVVTGEGLSFPRWGDPRPGCGSLNFGPQIRPDLNCDGVEDLTIDTSNPPDGIADAIGDSCPYYSQLNSVDLDPSPAVNTFNSDNKGRADECSCGDSNRDKTINVSDIVDVNLKIFNPPGVGDPWEGQAKILAPLSDTNDDDRINVSDIVGVNLEIFSVGDSSRCSRSPIIGE